MKDWHLRASDLKKYPHFDPIVPAKLAEAYATDAQRVARHAFFPFIQYSQRWTRFAKKGEKGKVKERPIRYAARQDSYIFSYYRHLLAQHYEKQLQVQGLSGSVLAYRHIPAGGGPGGKSNIHFAFDAFAKIRELGDCCVIALDVSSYFESLDHSRLKELWCRLIGARKLPPDHFHVFNAVTQYSWVEKQEVYERLGHFGDKTAKNGKLTRGYITPYKKVPKCLCNGRQFRERIAGEGALKSIIKRNYNCFGIPQGAPISDLLANLYLIDFDQEVAGWVRSAGGAYFRYSDDILILAPGGEARAKELMARARELIGNFGAKLVIKDEKSSAFAYRQDGSDQEFEVIHGSKGKNGLEYLGFRFDGKKVFLRDSTISNLRRKMARAAHSEAEACARRYPDKSLAKLKQAFDYARLFKRFGKVEDFGDVQSERRKWTFWTYATRSSKVFGSLGKPIFRQLRNQRALTRTRADKALERAVIRRDRRSATP